MDFRAQTNTEANFAIFQMVGLILENELKPGNGESEVLSPQYGTYFGPLVPLSPQYRIANLKGLEARGQNLMLGGHLEL